MQGICALFRNVLLEAAQAAFNTAIGLQELWTHLVSLPNPWKQNDTTCRSLPHSLRLSVENCKPNVRSSWSSSPGQDGSWSHHQNNALAPHIKHPFYILLFPSNDFNLFHMFSHFHRQNASSFCVCAWHTNLVVHVTDEAVAKCPAMMLSTPNWR